MRHQYRYFWRLRTIGRFFLGSFADRMGRDVFLVAMYFDMAASLAIWAGAGGFPALIVFALAFRLFYGGGVQSARAYPWARNLNTIKRICPVSQRSEVPMNTPQISTEDMSYRKHVD